MTLEFYLVYFVFDSVMHDSQSLLIGPFTPAWTAKLILRRESGSLLRRKLTVTS